MFYYHRYLTTNKYTIEDIYDKTYATDDAKDYLEPLDNTDLTEQNEFIQRYIEKKLST